MLGSPRHDAKLTGSERDHTITKLDAEAAAPDEEHLLGVLVAMPREEALRLHDFDLLPVQRRDDLGSPVLVERSELVGEIAGLEVVAHGAEHRAIVGPT